MPSVTWHLSNVRPTAWLEWVRACGGGVFHMPAGLLVDAPGGTAVYGRLVSPSGETVGVSLGMRYGCRLAAGERHLYVPTLPALTRPIAPHIALSTFKAHLRAVGFAEVTIGSYDAVYVPPFPDGTTPRLEYVIQIPPSGDVSPQLGATHRRHVRRGEREGWTVRLLTGAVAEAAILGVQQFTAERASSRNRGFAPAQGTAWVSTAISSLPLPDNGLVVLGAYRDESLLSSVLIGWAAERSFYFIGGSTPEGYQRGAATWLHYRAINLLAAHGIRTYNLGGTPADAANDSSLAHGLYRFKTGFGVSPVERHGVHWELQPRHVRLHHILTHLRRIPRRG